jgi:hypothetical protein
MSSQERAQALYQQATDKIQNLLKEFAAGELNREQFNVLYERYSGQLAMANQVMNTGNADLIDTAAGGQSTIAIKQQHMGKAIGMAIYHNRTGVSIETLGDFDVSAFTISPVLNDFMLLEEQERLAEYRVVELPDKRWLLFAGGKYSTVVTLFRNEPSPQQIREIERLHLDFELANGALLKKGHLDSGKMAYPFMVFVQKKLKKA